ncbi:MAG: fused MFS/spermidine synthase [Arenicellales bacterium]
MTSTDDGSHYRIVWYGITIFLSSAVLLVIEITAGRLIAPYVGVSIYSWTSIIGVILAGLSLGNWLGGWWADHGGDEKATGLVLALAGIFCLFSLLVLGLIAPMLQSSQLDLVSSSFLYVLGMFFLPSVLLGIPTPLLTTLALRLDERAGRIVGRMHALAALGSIIGTFLTGYVLIQYFGSRNIVTACAVVLFVLAAPFFSRTPKAPFAILVAFGIGLSAIVYARQGFSNPCDRESNYFCLRVVDASGEAPFGEARALILDHLLHSMNHQSEPAMLISPYVQLMDELVLAHFDATALPELAYFFAGGGAYTQPRAVKALTPQARLVVAELDPEVTRLSERELYVSTEGMEIFHGDARTVLYRLSDARFDVVVTDAFHDIAVPYHLVTREFAQLVKARMNSNGLFVTNIVDAFPDPKMVKSLTKTLQQEFDHVDIWLDDIPQRQQRMTYVISASNREIIDDTLDAKRGFERRWYRINRPLMSVGTPMHELPIFTDDFVPVERMIADLLLTPEGL